MRDQNSKPFLNHVFSFRLSPLSGELPSAGSALFFWRPSAFRGWPPLSRSRDSRHTFAVNRLLAWHREGANLFVKLPLLSTYLGHTCLAGIEVYLHATAELLESVGKRFPVISPFHGPPALPTGSSNLHRCLDRPKKPSNFTFHECRRFAFGPRESLGLDFPGLNDG
jgi:hypothetical protein